MKPLRIISGLYLVFSIFIFIFPYFIKIDPYSQNLQKRLLAPSKDAIFGRDEFGRDVFARVIEGQNNSLKVAGASTLIALFIGLFTSLISTSFSKSLDNLILTLNNVVVSMPIILISICLHFVFKSELLSLIVPIGIALSPIIYRVCRVEIKRIYLQKYVKSSIILGTSRIKIIYMHVLNELAITLSVQTAFLLSNSIIIESSLSFLGLGLKEPKSSLGNMLSNSKEIFLAPHIPFFTGLFLFLLILSINTISDYISSKFIRSENSF